MPGHAFESHSNRPWDCRLCGQGRAAHSAARVYVEEQESTASLSRLFYVRIGRTDRRYVFLYESGRNVCTCPRNDAGCEHIDAVLSFVK